MSHEVTPSTTGDAVADAASEAEAAEAAALDAAVEALAEQGAMAGRGALPAVTAPPASPPASPSVGGMAAHPIVHSPEETTDIVELLAKIHIFAGLQPAYLRRIAAVGTREQHQSGATVFSEGSEGDKMYLILSGAVRISRQVPGLGEEALAILRAGNYFGEMSLVDESPRSADAKAHEATELLVLKKDDLEDLLFVDRDLAYDLLWNFVRTLTSRLRDTNDKMTFLAVTNRF
jgi:CRP/FNR family transcriptional regulator, cyclic AMP receptor protein